MYLNRRAPGLVDLLIEQDWAKVFHITDGTSGDSGDWYFLSINGVGFREYDPNPGSDDSSTIASNFETAINGSTLPVTASASGSDLTVTSDEPGVKFSHETDTSDDEGSIWAETLTPEEYDILQADEWDGTFSVLETVPRNQGFRSSSLRTEASRKRNKLNPNQFRDRVRFLFDPIDYSLEDDNVLFLKVRPVINGADQAERPIEIVLTRRQLVDQHTALLLVGDAPIAADFDNAIHFNLPRQSSSVSITNNGTDDVFLSFESGNDELTLSQDETFQENRIATSILSVRTASGAGSASEVEIYVTLNSHPTL